MSPFIFYTFLSVKWNLKHTMASHDHASGRLLTSGFVMVNETEKFPEMCLLRLPDRILIWTWVIRVVSIREFNVHEELNWNLFPNKRLVLYRVKLLQMFIGNSYRYCLLPTMSHSKIRLGQRSWIIFCDTWTVFFSFGT